LSPPSSSLIYVSSHPVTDTIHHTDKTIVHLTIDGEELTTTLEHPFYVEGKGWVKAKDLQVGDDVRNAKGGTGEVEKVTTEQTTQEMYNLTVDEAHTFYVGHGQWLVHNTTVCPKIEIPKSRYPETAQHIEDAQAAGHSKILTIDREGAAANRSASLENYDPRPPLQRDEYPPAMFSEGGEGASVRYIDASDNMGAGACIGNQCRQYLNGTRVRIVVVP
jgi:Pretoxin HINT domain/Deoxyribonuclease NucA/NucB